MLTMIQGIALPLSYHVILKVGYYKPVLILGIETYDEPGKIGMYFQ